MKLLSILITIFLFVLSPVLHAEFVNLPGLGGGATANAAADNNKAVLVSNNSMSLLHDANDPVGGNPKGKVTLVEFFDYQCIHCIASDPIVNTVAKGNPDLRIVYKEYPIAGAVSTYAAKMALAANKQGKYFEAHEALMHMGTIGITEAKILAIGKTLPLDFAKLQKDMDSKEIDEQLKANYQLGAVLGITGTPAFVGAPTDLFGMDPNVFLSVGETDLPKLQDLLSKIKV